MAALQADSPKEPVEEDSPGKMEAGESFRRTSQKERWRRANRWGREVLRSLLGHSVGCRPPGQGRGGGLDLAGQMATHAGCADT